MRATPSPGPGDYPSQKSEASADKKAKPYAKPGNLGTKSCAALGERAPRQGTMFTIDPHFPFTEASFVLNPGPGKYGKEKGVNLRSLILEEESVRYPFNSSSARLFGGAVDTQMPGPGSYNPNPVNRPSPLSTTVSKGGEPSYNNSFIQNQSPFGSSISRFKFSYMNDDKG